MTLRTRLIALVAAVLLLSLAVGGVIACLNASTSVRNEMRSALQVGRQTVDNALRALPDSGDPEHVLDALVASFKANRHLRVSVTGVTEAAALPAADPAPFGEVPAWFVWLVGVAPSIDQVPIAVDGHSYGTVVIETDPRNEILEVWNEVSESVIVLAMFCGLTIALIHLFIGRALRPLDRLAAAIERIGRGDYRARIDERLTPELRPLRDNFNRMAARLAEIDADNRRLNEQLLTLQEQERADLARDLHDEVGPFLFAINVDAAAMARLIKERRTADLSERVEAVTDAVRHMQRQVRDMLGRLRPIGLAAFDLADAIDGMVEFWHRRHPEIDFRVDVAPACGGLSELADTTVYRVVQEALSNAVRHGKPTSITVTVAPTCDPDTGHTTTVVEVTDDGGGMSDAPGVGYGLIGIGERVKAIGGRLTVSAGADGGVTVTAVLPRADEQPPVAASLQDAAS